MKKTVLITGCSSGFGKLTALKFHREGWNVVATMRSPEKEKELTQLENLLVTRLDVGDQNSINESINKSVEKFGNIDVLVNNAGYGGHAFLEQFTEDQIYSMFETNVFGVMRMSRAVLPYMRKRRTGVIINVTSMAGYMGISLGSTYSASKFAVEGLTEAMAIEYKPFNIRVKAVAPGAFGTNFVAATDNSIENGDEELVTNAQKIITHFSNLIEQMLQQGGKIADSNEVADKIFECAISDMPVHNVVGSDAEMILGMKNSLSQEAFIDQISEMLTPEK